MHVPIKICISTFESAFFVAVQFKQNDSRAEDTTSLLLNSIVFSRIFWQLVGTDLDQVLALGTNVDGELTNWDTTVPNRLATFVSFHDRKPLGDGFHEDIVLTDLAVSILELLVVQYNHFFDSSVDLLLLFFRSSEGENLVVFGSFELFTFHTLKLIGSFPKSYT